MSELLVVELELQELVIELHPQTIEVDVAPERTEVYYHVRPLGGVAPLGGGSAVFERLELIITPDFVGQVVLPDEPRPNSLAVYLNGLLEFNYLLTGQTLSVSFQTAPGDLLVCTYAR